MSLETGLLVFKSAGEITVNLKALTEFFSVSKLEMDSLLKRGLSKACKLGHGYHLKKAFDWYAHEYIKTGGFENSRSLEDVKLLQAEINLKISECNLENLTKQYIHKDEIVGEWIKRLMEFQVGFWARVTRLAPLLVNKSVEDIVEIMGDYDI